MYIQIYIHIYKQMRYNLFAQRQYTSRTTSLPVDPKVQRDTAVRCSIVGCSSERMRSGIRLKGTAQSSRVVVARLGRLDIALLSPSRPFAWRMGLEQRAALDVPLVLVRLLQTKLSRSNRSASSASAKCGTDLAAKLLIEKGCWPSLHGFSKCSTHDS